MPAVSITVLKIRPRILKEHTSYLYAFAYVGGFLLLKFWNLFPNFAIAHTVLHQRASNINGGIGENSGGACAFKGK